MRNNVETRMCKACNAPLALRESCKTCADAARARLHAEGVAVGERKATTPAPERFRYEREASHHAPVAALLGYLTSFAGHRVERFGRTWAEDEGRLSRAKHEPPPARDVLRCGSVPRHGKQEAMREFQRVYQGAWEDGSPVHTNACGMPSPPVGAEVSYEVALRHMREAPEARYERHAMRHVDVYRMLNGQLCYQSAGLWCDVYLPDEKGRYIRLPDATTLPAIGEEVAWERAKADMHMRAFAVYRAKTLSGEYTWMNGALAHRESVLGTVGEWQTVPSWDGAHELRWVRLA